MKRIFSIVFALALVLGFSLVVTAPVAAAPGTWYVNGALGTDDGTHGTGPDAAALKTIQYAINDGRVGNGDTINVEAGTYQEDITINKSLTLQGAGRTTTTILRKTSADQVVDIEASDVTITGFKIDGGSGLACEYVIADYEARNQITWCHLLNCWDMAILFYSPTTAGGGKANDNIIEHFGGGGSNPPGTGGIGVYKYLNLEVKRNTIRDANPDGINPYAGVGVYFFDYTSGTIADNTISRVGCAVTVNSNVGETYVTNNTASECIIGILETESFAKVHITGNTISTRAQPTNYPRVECGIFLGGDGDWYNSSPPYPYQVDNLQHEVSGNIVTGIGTANSFGIKVEPGAFDRDYGASGTVNGNTISNYATGLLVCGTYKGGTLDLTSHVHVSFGFNNIVNCTTDAAVDTVWSGAAGGIDATKNWWGAVTGPHAISAKYDYSPWTGKIATSTGTGTASFTPDAGNITTLSAVGPCSTPPVTLPHGMFLFTVMLDPGQTQVTINITLPTPMPVGTKWWKCQGSSWHSMDIGDDDGDNFITVTLRDNQTPDDEDSTLHQITDQGGPAPGGAVGWETYPVNKLRVFLPWIALLAAIVAGVSLLVLRRRRAQS